MGSGMLVRINPETSSFGPNKGHSRKDATASRHLSLRLHDQSVAMLKRQRPVSPMLYPIDCTMEAHEAPEDLYEPDLKRRRYFTPSEADKSPWRDAIADEVDAESGHGDGSSKRRSESRYGEVREWQSHAGEYKTVNILLHDLHAEQRHRAIFASPSTAYSSFGSDATSSAVPEAASKKNLKSLFCSTL